MDKSAVLIDGAYLGYILKHHFGEPRLDYALLAQWACQGETLFRTCYYDCLPYQSSPPTDEEREQISKKQRFFTALSRLNRFSVVQGRVEYRGTGDDGRPIFQQKRVDLQIGLEVSMLVHRGLVSTIALVTGDSDMLPAVEMAQKNGVIVRLVHGPRGEYHQDLWDTVDERLEITQAEIDKLLLKR